MNMIIDKFAAKVGDPWILRTNLTECFILQKIQCDRISLYGEKTDTEKKKDMKKEEKTSSFIHHSYQCL